MSVDSQADFNDVICHIHVVNQKPSQTHKRQHSYTLSSHLPLSTRQASNRPQITVNIKCITDFKRHLTQPNCLTSKTAQQASTNVQFSKLYKNLTVILMTKFCSYIPGDIERYNFTNSRTLKYFILSG